MVDCRHRGGKGLKAVGRHVVGHRGGPGHHRRLPGVHKGGSARGVIELAGAAVLWVERSGGDGKVVHLRGIKFLSGQLRLRKGLQNRGGYRVRPGATWCESLTHHGGRGRR